jgi:peptidoglycan/LPS O-acetylase OafA/YrhL
VTVPEPRPSRGTRRPLGRRWWVAGVAAAVLIVVFLAPLASGDPDGLERVAADQGFLDRAVNFWGGLLSGYAVPGVSGPLSTVLSGLLGVAIVLGVMLLLGRMLARRRG